MSLAITMKTVLATASILSFAPQALCHMEMSWPYAIRSKYNPANNYENIDYSMTSPLDADGSNFPCKGYQNDRPISSVVTYTAGSTYNMTLAGSATHGGGSCQLSLSYDNGATFRVIKSMMGGCPLTTTYDFTIPSYAPNGEALFAWTWQNEQGNREYYMNCAEVTIEGSTASKRDTYTTFESLPFIWKANLEGINDCVTIAGDDPVYPLPGPDVLYGGSITSSSAASSDAGVCDAATPFGQTYEYLSDTDEPETATVATSAATSAAKSSSAKATTTSSTKAATTLSSSVLSSSAASTKASSSSSSKKTSTSTSSKKTSTSTSSKKTSTSTKASSTTAKVSTTTKASTTSTTPASSSDSDDCEDVTMTVYTSSGTSTASSASSTSTESVTDSEYATGNLTTYLPCVPGTYLCTSASTWVTCDQTMYSDGSTAWVYEESRSLGNGAVCVPSFSPYTSSTKAYAQQADSPSGYYRDDRIAYTTGESCTDDGAIECVGSSEFDLCADAVWYQMGAVASGTTCSNDELVVS